MAAQGKPVVGVDLGGTKILAAVVDPEGRIISRAKKKTKPQNGSTNILVRMAKVIEETVDESGLKMKDIAAIGIGTPGPLDPETGIVEVAPNLGWKNVNVKKAMEDEFHVPTFVENDVNAGTYGEFKLGAGKGVSSLVGIFIGTGIGGGIIIDGKLHRGKNLTAGEIGHVVLVPEGPLCGCGKRGCLEALASRTAIDRMIRKQLEKGKESVISEIMRKKKNAVQIKSRALADAFEQKDKVVCDVLKEATWYLGLAVGGVINFLNPEMIVLGGGVVEAMEEFYLAEVTKTAKEYSFPNASKGIKIVASRLGDDAGVLGSAVIAQSRLES